MDWYSSQRGSTAILLALLLVLCPSPSLAQNFTDFEEFLRRYEATSAEFRTELARSFAEWQQARGGFPIAEANGSILFVYLGSGEEQDVRLTGDFRPVSFFNPYWDSVGEPMAHVGSVFYSRHIFENDARIDYKFVIDGKGTLDPLNPRTIFSGVGDAEVSELVMPGHRLPTEAILQAGVPQGTLHAIEEAWATPKVMIYLPPTYDSSRNYPTLYTADGSAWMKWIRLPAILDNLIAERAIEPVIAVMIDAAENRRSWYYFNPDYLTYLQRVVNYVDGRYTTRARADARLHAGTSAGGRASAYVGFELPEVFGNLAMLSPSLDGPLHYYEPYFSGRKRPEPDLRVWMSAGTYEGYIQRDTETMAAYYNRIGIQTKAVYLHQGHSFGAWRESAAEMLRYFFPLGR